MDREVTLKLSPEAQHLIEEIAEARNQPIADVFRDALALAQYVFEVQQQGGHILVELPGKPTVRLLPR